MDDLYGRMIRLAARMLNTTTPPSRYIDDHEHVPKRVPARWWRWMCDRLFLAEEERREWAIEVRDIADRMNEQMRELAACGVEHDDPRLDYITVQIPRVVWDELRRGHGPRT